MMKNNDLKDLLLYENTISAGFPSPGDDDIFNRFDLHKYLIKNPAATFLLRVSGSSMTQAGIHHNDIVIVDRSLPPAHGKIVIAAVNGELTVKRLLIEGKKVSLQAENPGYPSIPISGDMELHIWGVVSYVIHPV